LKYLKTKAAVQAADAETTTEEVLVVLAEAEAAAEDLVVNEAVLLVVAAAVLDLEKKVVLVDVVKDEAVVSDRIDQLDVQMHLNQTDLVLEHPDVRNHLATAHVLDAPEKTKLSLLIFY
jgi:hypothetical protein